MMKRNYYIVALILLTFFVISFLTNIIGPLIPDIIKGFNLNLTLVSLLPFAFFIAYGVVSIPTGILLERYKEKKIMVAAFVLAFFGSLLLALFPNYITAIISLFLIGCGMAMLQVVINPLLRTSGCEEHYAFNGVLAQLIFGLASFISPLFYSFIILKSKKGDGGSVIQHLVPQTLPWIVLYWIFAIICILMILIVAFSKFPKVELQKEEVAGSIKTHLMLFRMPVVLSYFIAIICYVGTEQGIADWISKFLTTYYGLDPETTGAKTVAYFWGFMTAGGIIGLFLLKIWDSRKILIAFTILALISFSFALNGGASVSLIAFPITGFFASVMYPIIFSLALNSVKEHHGSFAGILVTGIIGGAIVPLIIGWLGDWLGLRTGMLFLYLTMGFILSIGFWAKPLITNKTLSLNNKAE